MNTTIPLDIPGSRAKVELENPDGIFYKIRMGGEVIKRRRGGWLIPLRNGGTGRLRSSGVVPGFQTLTFEGEDVYKMGKNVGTAERVAMFAPLLLVIWLTIGAILGLILFFMGLQVVKNTLMPRALRIALPIINTIAGGAILFVLTGRLGILG